MGHAQGARFMPPAVAALSTSRRSTARVAESARDPGGARRPSRFSYAFLARRNAVKTRLLALALMLGVVAAAPSASAAEFADTRPGAFPISWKQCPDRPEVQCGTLRVPLDWARPRGEKITLALARHRATDPAHRIGALFVNPGGPGGGGVQIATNADLIFSPELVSRF